MNQSKIAGDVATALEDAAIPLALVSAEAQAFVTEYRTLKSGGCQ